jgi:hypothetical protein
MRPLKNLTLEAMIEMCRERFKSLPEKRAVGECQYGLEDVLLSGLALMFFQYPSLLSYQREMEQKRKRSNLSTIFGVSRVPSDTQMREIIDGTEVEPLRQILPEIFERMRRSGWVVQFRTEVGQVEERSENYYTLALDGSDYFHSSKIQCGHCLRRSEGKGEVHYRHTVVSASLVKAGKREVLPVDFEEVRNEDGQEKQDCEVNAAKRLVPRLRGEHPQLKLIVVGDDLYSREPFIALLGKARMHYVLVAKESSHPELFSWVADLESLGETERGEWSEGPVAKQRRFEYRIVRGVPINGELERMVNFLEVWEVDRGGKQRYHNSWVTDLEVNAGNIAAVVQIGRSRWKIENEQFNVQKNHGYELEHNYGHGKQTLAMVFYVLNLLAYLMHTILDMGDRRYQQCLQQRPRRELWEQLRVWFNRVLLESWEQLMRLQLGELEVGGASP